MPSGETRMLLGGLVLALALAGCSTTTVDIGPRAADRRPGATISVSGTGRVHVKPDVAVAQVGVEAREASLAAATSEVARRMTAVLARLRDRGVADRDITTVVYTVEPIEAPRRQADDPVRIVGFRVANVVQVKIRDIAAAGPTLEAALAEGATALRALHFTLDDPAPAEAAARAQAVQDAAARARQLAEAAGVRLGELVSLVESAPGPRPVAEHFARATLAAATAPGPIETGELQVTVTVDARYRIDR